MATGAAIAMVGLAGVQAYQSYDNAKKQQHLQKQSLEIQDNAQREQSEELARQKKIQQDRQRRENEQLMNAVSNLTNTSFGGVSSPTIEYDKYGDLG